MLEWKKEGEQLFAQQLQTCPSLEGKVVAITGTTSGTGFYLAEFVVRKQAKALFCLNRESPRSKAAIDHLEQVKKNLQLKTAIIPIACDLASFESVRSAAKQINLLCSGNEGSFPGLNVLINNAGTFMYTDERTVDGYEFHMQVNFLSHALLIKEMFPAILNAYRVDPKVDNVRICQQLSFNRQLISHALEEKYFAKCDPDTLGKESLWQGFLRYRQSKLALACFGMVLQKKIAEGGYDTKRFKVMMADPGLAKTTIITGAKSSKMPLRSWLAGLAVGFFNRMQSPADGAAPAIRASFGIDANNGDLYVPLNRNFGEPIRVFSNGTPVSEKVKKLEKAMLDDANQALAWKRVEEIFGNILN